MALVTGGVAAAILVAAGPAAAGVGKWKAEIAEASRRFSIPAEWIARVMNAESGGRTWINGRPATSPAGAMGLMQLMPATWNEIRLRHGLGDDPHQPRDNILAGTAYLKDMYDRFGYPGLFAAYNAGPGAYARHLQAGSPLPRETRTYLARVLGEEAGARAAGFSRGSRRGAKAVPSPGASDAPIFVPLSGSRR